MSFRYSWHPKSRNKTELRAVAYGWKTNHGTIKDVLDHAKAGKAVTGAIFKDGHRCNADVLARQVFELDFDDGLTLDEFLEHSFSVYCAGVYTSANHQKVKHQGTNKEQPAVDRFRALFVAQREIADQGEMKAIILALHKVYGGKADPAAAAISNMFCGNDSADIPLENPSARLPIEFIEKAIADHLVELAEREKVKAEKEELRRHFADRQAKGLADADELNQDKLIELALDHIPPNDYSEWLRVGLALHSEGEHYFSVWDRWSSSGTDYNPKEVEQKWRSFSSGSGGSGVKIATLFHLAKEYGYVAPAKVRKAYVKKIKAVDSEKAIARFDITPNLVISDGEKYLPDGIIPTDKKIVGLKAPKGCGKSVQQGKYIKLLRSRGFIPIQVTHRQNLSSEKAKEWGLVYLEANKSTPTFMPIEGVSAVADSLLKLQSMHNFPWEKIVLIFDEAEQVLDHICTSTTAIKNVRAAVMSFIGELAERCHQIVLADADLKTISVNWAKALAKCGDDDVYIIQKKYKHNRDLIIMEDIPDLLVELQEKIEQGQNVFNFVTGQQVDSRFGSQNLESYFLGMAKSLIRVDSDTNKDPDHEAFRIAKNIEKLFNHQLSIATATVGTGVSVEGDHFDAVMAIASGGSPVESFCQATARVRNDCPRYIAVSTTAGNLSQKYGGCTSVSELMMITGKRGDEVRKQLKSFEDWGDNWFANPWVKAFAERTCLNNELGKDYQGSVIKIHEDEGYRVKYKSRCTKTERKNIRELLDQGAIKKVRQYISDILSNKPLLGNDLRAAKSATTKTYSERCSEIHGDILTLYGTDDEAITAAHITQRGFYNKLQLHFWLTQDSDSLKRRDIRKLNYLRDSSDGRLFKTDIIKSTLSPKVETLRDLGLGEILRRGYVYSGCPAIEKIKGILSDDEQRKAIAFKLDTDLEDCPRKNVGSIAKWFLENYLGLTMEREVVKDKKGNDKVQIKRIRKTIDGQRVMISPIDFGKLDRTSIFTFWEQNILIDDARESEAIAPLSMEENQGMITPESGSQSAKHLFFIENCDPPLETPITQDFQRVDHNFLSSLSNESPPKETPPILESDHTPSPAPMATAIAPCFEVGDRIQFYSSFAGEWLVGQVKQVFDGVIAEYRVLSDSGTGATISNPALMMAIARSNTEK